MPQIADIIVTNELGFAVLTAVIGAFGIIWKWAVNKDARYEKYREDLDAREEVRRSEDREMLISHVQSETVIAPLMERNTEALEKTTEVLERWTE